MVAILIAAFVFASQAATQAPVSIPLARVEGIPVKVAWSRDDQSIYIATAKTTERGAPTLQQYVVNLATSEVVPVREAPDWVTAYWDWKSDRTSQRWPELTIEVPAPQKKKFVGGPEAMGGAMSKESLQGTTTAVGELMDNASSTEKVLVYSLVLKGHTIYESTVPPNPGLTFGWVPSGDGPVMVYVNERGRLSAMQKDGKQKEVKDTDKAATPAVSWNASRLAFMHPSGRKEWTLTILEMPR